MNLIYKFSLCFIKFVTRVNNVEQNAYVIVSKQLRSSAAATASLANK